MNKEMNIIHRMIGIIVKPTKTFEYLNEKPDFFVPILLYIFTVFLASILILLMPEKFNFPGFLLNSKAMLFFIMIVGGMIYLILSWFLKSITLLILARLIGQKGNFRSILSIVGYTYMPEFIGGIISSIYAILTNRINLVEGLAKILPPEEYGSLLYVVLSKIDLYKIWSLVLLIFGISIIFKTSKRKSFFIVLFYWLLIILYGYVRLNI
ncbi:MAG: Yip1 family protein [Candidatus Methanofastidiosia archaeon]